jgi:hypothetical protein
MAVARSRCGSPAMGKYLDIIARTCDISDISDKTPPVSCAGKEDNRLDTFGRLSRFCRTFAALESRCPDRVPTDRWQRCVEDGRRFLATWGSQAESLGWDSRDLFGLHTPPANPHPSYSRMSRYDATGLVWLLAGRPVIALTETTAAISTPKTGSVLTYRKANKPALGPPGDSLDDLT